MSRKIRRPVTPVMSLTTRGSWTIHLHERFLHALGITAGASRRASGGAAGSARRATIASAGRKLPAQEPDAVELTDPLAVRHVALAAGYVLEMPCVHEQDLEAPCLENLVDRDPVDASGFHRHACHPQAVSQSASRSRSLVKVENGLDRGADSDRAGPRHSAPPTPQSIPATFGLMRSSSGRRNARLTRGPTAIVFHRRLLHTARSIREQGGGIVDILPNGITGV